MVPPGAAARATGRSRAVPGWAYPATVVIVPLGSTLRTRRLPVSATYELPVLLRLLAAPNTGELNRRSLGNDTGIPERTLSPYLRLLETLYRLSW